MATATNYQLQNNSAKSSKGRISEITAMSKITGITAIDHTWVDQVLAATNMPAFGTILQLATGERLVLEEINPRLIEGQKTTAEAELVYRTRDGSSSETGETPILEGGTAIKMVETSRDRNGNPIEVEHTWADDTKATWPNGKPKAGDVETVTATITVPVPMSTLTGEIYVQTATPGAITKAYAGHVNSQTWQAGAARTWMCTEARFRLVDYTSSPPIYVISFSFEYDDQTWDNDTTAFFIDPQTGMLPQIDPANLPLPNGKEVVQVQWAPEKNFNEDF